MRCDAVKSIAMRAVQCGAVRCGAMRYRALQCVQCSAVRCGAVAVQCGAVRWRVDCGAVSQDVKQRSEAHLGFVLLPAQLIDHLMEGQALHVHAAHSHKLHLGPQLGVLLQRAMRAVYLFKVVDDGSFVPRPAACSTRKQQQPCIVVCGPGQAD